MIVWRCDFLNFANNHSRILFSFHTAPQLFWNHGCTNLSRKQMSPAVGKSCHIGSLIALLCFTVWQALSLMHVLLYVSFLDRFSFFTDAWNNKPGAVQPPWVVLTHLTCDRYTGWKPWQSMWAENTTKDLNWLMNVGKLVEEICLCLDQELSSRGQRTVSHFSALFFVNQLREAAASRCLPVYGPHLCKWVRTHKTGLEHHTSPLSFTWNVMLKLMFFRQIQTLLFSS